MITSAKKSFIMQLQQMVTTLNLEDHHHLEQDNEFEAQLRQFLETYAISISDVHVLAYIGEHQNTNAISIANALGITRSGISKITARLLKKELIQAQHAENSKKELAYVLTPAGQEIHFVHGQVHQQIFRRLETVLDAYSEEEIDCIQRFLADLERIF